MSRSLLIATLATAALSASLESIASGGSAVPPPAVWAGIAGAGIGLGAIGAAAPQLANGLTGLVLLTVLYRLPWGLVTGALDQLGGPTTNVPRNLA